MYHAVCNHNYCATFVAVDKFQYVTVRLVNNLMMHRFFERMRYFNGNSIDVYM